MLVIRERINEEIQKYQFNGSRLFFLFYENNNEKNKWNNGGCMYPKNNTPGD